jgi:outer membrane protein assembly factor BamA
MGKLDLVGLDESRAASIEQLFRLHPGDPFDSTAISAFAQEIAKKLPHLAPGWIVGNPVQTIHADTKTVDLRFTFHPTGSH